MPYCDDCGLQHEVDREEHLLVCEARSCVACETVYDRMIVPNQHGERICRACQRQDDLELAYSAEEEGEDEDGFTQA